MGRSTKEVLVTTNMKLYVCLVVLIGLVTTVSCQRISWGKCKTPEVKQNFTLQKYLGTWYEYERDFVVFEFMMTCGRANYSLNEDGSVKVRNTGTLFGKAVDIYGSATVPDPKEPAKLVVKFFDGDTETIPNYWVVDTDYDNFSVVYSCRDIARGWFDVRSEIVWILTRDRNGVSEEQLEAIYEELEDKDIGPRGRLSPFGHVTQENCPY